jgi:hypothetical protein
MSATATKKNGEKPPRKPRGTATAERAADASPTARRGAAAILEVWAGVRTPQQAASALGLSLPRYYQIEQRAVTAVVASCEPQPRGPGPNYECRIRGLERQLATSRRDAARLQALLRTSQRTLGLAPAPAPAPAAAGKGGKRRAKKPTARALKFAKVLAANSAGENPAVGIEPTGESAVSGATRVAVAASGAGGNAP